MNDPVEAMIESYFRFLRSHGWRIKTSELSFSRYVFLRGRQVLTVVSEAAQ